MGLLLDNPDKYMKIGTSAEFGTCPHAKEDNKLGECGAFINKYACKTTSLIYI